MNVFDILAQRTGRESLSELQKRELRNNVVSDFVDFFYIRNRFSLWLIKRFRLAVDGYFFGLLVYPVIKHYAFNVIALPHYQSLFDDFYKDINKTLVNNGISLKLNGIEDVGRWSVANAEYISTFGIDSRISVNSGMIYFLHVFCRCLQPFLMENDNSKRANSILLWLMKRQFKRASIAFCTNNHRLIISMISMVPEDGTLLEGMEMFVLCHELGHAYYTQYGEEAWPFEMICDPAQMDRMKNDEEYAADIFSIHMLHLMDGSQEGEFLLYGAVLFFLILSWYEEAEYIKKPVKHPLSKARYDYLLEEIKAMDVNIYRRCLKYTKIMNTVWLSCMSDVNKGIEKSRKNRSKYEDSLEVVREYAMHYFRCEEIGEN